MFGFIRVVSTWRLGLSQPPWRSASRMKVVAAGSVQGIEANCCARIVVRTGAGRGRQLEIGHRALASSRAFSTIASFQGGFTEKERQGRKEGQGSSYHTKGYAQQNDGRPKKKKRRHVKRPQADPKKGLSASHPYQSKTIIGRLKTDLTHIKRGAGPTRTQLLTKLRLEGEHFNASAIHLMWTIVGHKKSPIGKVDDLLQELMNLTLKNMPRLDSVCIVGVFKQLAVKRIEVPEMIYKPMLKKIQQAAVEQDLSFRDLSECLWAFSILKVPLDTITKALLTNSALEIVKSEDLTLFQTTNLARNMAEASIPLTSSFLSVYTSSIKRKKRKFNPRVAANIAQTCKLWNIEVPSSIVRIIEKKDFLKEASQEASLGHEVKPFEALDVTSKISITKEVDQSSGGNSLTENAQLGLVQVQNTNGLGMALEEDISAAKEQSNEEIKLQDTNETNEKSKEDISATKEQLNEEIKLHGTNETNEKSEVDITATKEQSNEEIKLQDTNETNEKSKEDISATKEQLNEEIKLHGTNETNEKSEVDITATKEQSNEEIKLQDTNETNEKSEGENVGKETLSNESLLKGPKHTGTNSK